jgi:metallo-beta-lactamase family protein
MCEAGRILHHLANNIGNPRNTIMMIGYCAEHTLGRKLIGQAVEVKIFGEIFQRNAEVVVHNSFSAHADHNELLRYIGRFDKQSLKNIFVVHGEPERSAQLAEALGKSGFGGVQIPNRGDKIAV